MDWEFLALQQDRFSSNVSWKEISLNLFSRELKYMYMYFEEQFLKFFIEGS